VMNASELGAPNHLNCLFIPPDADFSDLFIVASSQTSHTPLWHRLPHGPCETRRSLYQRTAGQHRSSGRKSQSFHCVRTHSEWNVIRNGISR